MAIYTTSGVCAKKIEFLVEAGIVTEIEFQSGCSGNLQGVSRLAEGMRVEDVIKKLKGIKCGDKNSSCPDQLARALEAFSNKDKG
ncbi:MAG: uncharacterized protein K0R22_397 [Sporomusa sp.]|jgi:uncharacterized protein (TIGR03905 family)|nr:uncharacterized protein [Sporomusa sp.]